MKKILVYCYNNTRIGYYSYHFIKWIFDAVRYNRFTDKHYTVNKFKEIQGYELNLCQPKTFNEKIQWLKFNDMDELKTQCSDKYLVREFIESEIGAEYLIPLIFTTKSAIDVTVEKLPDYPVIVKVNHASGKVFIVKDKQVINYNLMRESLTYQLRRNFYYGHREYQYKDIKPRIIIEKLLLYKNGEIPEDFKIHCFNGKPKFIQVDTARFTEHTRCIYDTSWNLLEVELQKPKGKRTDKPAQLEAMLQIAKKLSRMFLYVRVDLYEVNEKVYFGELTFTSGAGLEIFKPKSIDLLWGKELKLPVDDS